MAQCKINFGKLKSNKLVEPFTTYHAFQLATFKVIEEELVNM